MFFSFFDRFTSKPIPTYNPPKNKSLLEEAVRQEGGTFFSDFKLFHQNSVTLIDILIFFPHRGLYFGEKVLWTADELKGAKVERASKRAKKMPSTRLENTEAKIHQKLQDVLSFDSTICERFFWMENLTEDEFDGLDPTFHQLLPKSRLIFHNDSLESMQNKLNVLAEYLNEPYSFERIIGSLNSHTLLLPTRDTLFGKSLSDTQNHFLLQKHSNVCITLSGGYGTGKSTLIIRKALILLLDDPHQNILIITPTLLASELLRKEFVSLLEYSALNIDLNRINFISPQNDFEGLKPFHDATSILCDDSHLMDNNFIQNLKELQGERFILFSTIKEPDPSEESLKLFERFRNYHQCHTIQCTSEGKLATVLSTLRKHLINYEKNEIIVILPEQDLITAYKEAIDEYFGSNCRILTPHFSLQYQDLDDLILTTSECIGGISTAHLILVSQKAEDYTYILSRASETATIISVFNSHGESDEQNHQNR